MNKVVPAQSLRNIQNIPDFLETKFKPYITSHKPPLYAEKIYDDYQIVDFSTKNRSIPLKKYKEILYNFTELLQLYNTGMVRIDDTYMVMTASYAPDGEASITIRSVKLYDNPYLHDEYIVVILDTNTHDFKQFPGYTRGFLKKEYYNIYDKEAIRLIFNCYTYDQFIKAIKGRNSANRNRIVCLLPDILRIVYSYAIA